MRAPLPPELRRDLEFAVHAARAAGERAMALRASGRWSDDTLADVGDQATDGLLQGMVRGRYPDDGILSEETADTRERLSKSRVWIVDPLDGTKEYAQMRPDWAVHVALTIGGECALGAVALPAKGLVLSGVCVKGMESAELEGPGRLVDGASASPELPRIAVSRSHTPKWVEKLAERMNASLVHAGSVGNKVCLLLLGEADVYVHRKRLHEWDTCAPETVARALGWTVCKLRGEEHRYNGPDSMNHGFVVCRPAWKDRVLASLEAVGALRDAT